MHHPMKKHLPLVVLSFLILLLSGCKKNDDSSSKDPSQKYISGDIWFNSGYNTLCQTSDGGFAVAALVGEHRIYVAKTTSSFDIQWDKTFASNILDVGGIVESSDKGFVIICNFNDTISHPNRDFIDLIKLNQTGELLWEKKYEFRYLYSTGFAIKETSDKGFIITTVHDKFNNQGRNFIELFKVNSNGDSIWSCDYSDHSYTSGHDIQLTSDNGFIAVGANIVLRTDSLGNKLWDQYFTNITFTNVRLLSDGSCIALGSKVVSPYSTTNGLDYILMKFDQNGNIQWEKLYDLGDHEYSANLCLTPEGGFLFSGISEIESYSYADVVIIKTDGEGNQITAKTLDMGYSPQAWGLVCQNGSYVYYGGTTLSTGLSYYMVLMRFNL